jgi:hypothetical protein
MDFFLMGSFDQLVDASFKHVEKPRLRFWLKECAKHILQNQFVRWDLGDMLLQVAKGSGMGLAFSGDLADSLFHDLAEAGHSSLETVLEASEVYLYIRYRDDILVIYNRNAQGTGYQFLQKLIRLAKPVYKVICESVDTSANFLDIHIYKGPDFMQTGTFQYKPYVKATQQRVYLNHYSMHPGAVHSAWPLAETSRLFRRSSCWKHFAEARSVFAQKLMEVFTHPNVVMQVLSWCPSTKPKTSKCRVVWVIIPYCPRISGLQRVVSRIVDTWRSKGFLFPFDVRVSHCRADNTSLRSYIQDNRAVEGG